MMLAPDPAVPHRDELLDGDRVAELLSGRLLDGEPVEACRRKFAKYRVGDGLRVVYRIVAGGREHHVAARGFAPGASAVAYHRALSAAVPAPPLRPVVHVPELDAVFWTFPNDRRLSTLPLLAGRSGTLDRLVGRARVTPRLVAYSAERSASAECATEDGRVLAYAKVHTGDVAERERRRLEDARAAESDCLHVPRVIGTSALDGALAVEAVPGRSLEELDESELPDALRRLGCALAMLHDRAPLPSDRFERLDIERLAKAVSVIARARPDAGPGAAELLARLLGDLGDAAGPHVYLHGDANLRNAIFDDDRVTLIDFEDASAGPAAADLGQVLARLRAARLTDAITATTETELAAAAARGLRRDPRDAARALAALAHGRLRARPRRAPRRQPRAAVAAREPPPAAGGRMTVRPPLLFYCQHSVGLGHLTRSYALCAHLAEWFRVVLVCGGSLPEEIDPPPGVEIVALPPLGVGAGSRFVSHDPRFTVERAWAVRGELLLRTLRTLRPGVVFVELFPFGRAKFARELVPLLELAREGGAMTACSLRDILVTGRDNQAGHDERACRLANAHLDAILVHSDPRFARLEETFAPAGELTVPVRYTGFVVGNGLPRRRGARAPCRGLGRRRPGRRAAAERGDRGAADRHRPADARDRRAADAG